MQYKDKNGVWWNRDPHGLSYYDGEKWVRHSGSGSGSASSYTAAQPASNTETQQTWNTGPQQTSYTGPQQTLYGGQQQTLYEGQQLGPASAPDVATAMAIFPQNSAPYEAPKPLVTGINRQTQGQPAVPRITLDPTFREGAKNSPLIQAFVKAMDNMAEGKV